MSNYILWSALELQCRYALSDRKVIAIYVLKLHVTFPLLDAVQDVVATLFDEHGRVVLIHVLSSYHAVLRDHSVD